MNQVLLTRDQLRETVIRFPMTMLACVLFCGVAIFNNHYPGIIKIEFAIATTFLASAWLLVCKLLFESLNRPQNVAESSFAASFLVAMMAYVYAYPRAFNWHVALFAVMSIVLVPIAPFIFKSSNRDHIFVFSFLLARQAVMAGIITAIICAGLIAIALTINLLSNNQDHRVFFDIAIFCGSIIFSTITLTGIPRDFARDELHDNAHFINALIGYLVVPLLIFYGGILYWYFIVLCFTQTLPKGVIVFMTTGFATVGILAHLAIDHSKVVKMATVNLFQKHFFKALLVPLCLMAQAIGIRIVEHGLSQARFIVVMIWFWLLLVSLFSFTKYHERLSRFIYLSAAIMAFITALTMIWL